MELQEISTVNYLDDPETKKDNIEDEQMTIRKCVRTKNDN